MQAIQPGTEWENKIMGGPAQPSVGKRRSLFLLGSRESPRPKEEGRQEPPPRKERSRARSRLITWLRRTVGETARGEENSRLSLTPPRCPQPSAVRRRFSNILPQWRRTLPFPFNQNDDSVLGLST